MYIEYPYVEMVEYTDYIALVTSCKQPILLFTYLDNMAARLEDCHHCRQECTTIYIPTPWKPRFVLNVIQWVEKVKYSFIRLRGYP
jgi:hypothetical protein